MPLSHGKTYGQATSFKLVPGGPGGSRFLHVDVGGECVGLLHPERFVAVKENNDGGLRAIVLRNNGLHIVIEIDPTHRIGKTHPAGECKL